MKKIAIVGPESTGKTFLAKALAKHYHCPWVTEYAREYLNQINRPYTKNDLHLIARGQLKKEDEYDGKSDLLFCDTNLIVMKVWWLFKYKSSPKWIDQEIRRRPYALHLLLAPDLPWEDDPLREAENQEDREVLFRMYKAELEYYGLAHQLIEGAVDARLHHAIKSIDAII